MILRDFHTHTTYCDGKSSAEEMVCAAIELGMTHIGITCHSYTDFDGSYCIKKEDIPRFKSEIGELAQKYKSKIKVYCGVEQEYYSSETTNGFDYSIGSVHYVKKDNVYLDVDLTEKQLSENVEKFYGGDYIAFCEDYYQNVGDVISKTGADIIGHFDLVTKFNEGGRLFDTKNQRYVDAAKTAVDKLIKYDKPFEINTGAISRGWRSEAYPESSILKYIFEKGGRVILSSDSHSKDTLCCQFDKYERIAREIGFEL